MEEGLVRTNDTVKRYRYGGLVMCDPSVRRLKRAVAEGLINDFTSRMMAATAFL